MTEFAETRPDPLDGAFNSDWLMGQSFPPVEYVVPGLIPEGLTLLTAAPKIGKSWMVLGLGYAAATGGLAFGKIRVQQRPVLYLALEDGQRRLQGRLRTIGAQDGHRLLTMMTSTPPGVSAVETIAAFLERHAGQRPMVVLDTLGKVRGVYTGNDAYQKDYGQMSALKDLVDAWPGTSLIVVHHTKKAETTDFLDSVSGTQGLAGAADSILVLRRDRQSQGAVLHVTSRDAAEGEYAVTLTDGSWSLDGSSLADAAQAVQNREAVAGLGDQMTELVNVVNRYPEGIRRQELLGLTHMEPSTLDTYLRRASESGRITRTGRGRYTPVRSVRSVSSEGPEPPNLTVLTHLTPLRKESPRDTAALAGPLRPEPWHRAPRPHPHHDRRHAPRLPTSRRPSRRRPPPRPRRHDRSPPGTGRRHPMTATIRPYYWLEGDTRTNGYMITGTQGRSIWVSTEDAWDLCQQLADALDAEAAR